MAQMYFLAFEITSNSGALVSGNTDVEPSPSQSTIATAGALTMICVFAVVS
jgi:hypothetical protein